MVYILQRLHSSRAWCASPYCSSLSSASFFLCRLLSGARSFDIASCNFTGGCPESLTLDDQCYGGIVVFSPHEVLDWFWCASSATLQVVRVGEDGQLGSWPIRKEERSPLNFDRPTMQYVCYLIKFERMLVRNRICSIVPVITFIRKSWSEMGNLTNSEYYGFPWNYGPKKNGRDDHQEITKEKEKEVCPKLSVCWIYVCKSTQALYWRLHWVNEVIIELPYIFK